MAYLRAFGPLFDGRGYAELGRFGPALRQVTGRAVRNRVVGHMVQSYRNPTPYYWTTVAERERGDATVVHGDHSLAYEFWLEGIGTRNYPVTRFRGYATWRTVTRGVPGWFDTVVQPTVAETVRRLNG